MYLDYCEPGFDCESGTFDELLKAIVEVAAREFLYKVNQASDLRFAIDGLPVPFGHESRSIPELYTWQASALADCVGDAGKRSDVSPL
jgi:hypothetical protein